LEHVVAQVGVAAARSADAGLEQRLHVVKLRSTSKAKAHANERHIFKIKTHISETVDTLQSLGCNAETATG
jgi:hypothetical protein